VRVEEHDPDLVVPSSYEDLDSVGYLGGHGLGELLNLEQEATEVALGRAGRLTSLLRCPRLNAFVVGELVYLLEMETVVVAALLGVNPFDQPALDDLKRLTYGLAGRVGFEGGRADAQRWLARKEAAHVV
jgi:glucose-6-phosphate isomerase